MQVSKVIRQHGYDVEAVAKQMGLTKSSLGKSISNAGNPSIGKLRQIAQIIGADLADFFEDERKHPNEETAPTLQTTDRIKQIMKDKGLSVTEVSKRMGVLPQSLSRTLRQGSFRVTTLKAIADAIGCTVEDITEDNTTSSIICPHCGKEITFSIHAHDNK